MSKSIMLDIETMGVTPGTVILSIGAVEFGDGKIISRFEKIIDVQSSLDAGCHIDASTLMWWMQQTNKARAQFKKKGVPLAAALQYFAFWVDDQDCEMWGNGVGFDNVLLRSTYAMCNLDAPWEWWNDKCYRTVKSMFPEIELERVGTHHYGVDDAESQALHLMKMLDKLKEG